MEWIFFPVLLNLSKITLNNISNHPYFELSNDSAFYQRQQYVLSLLFYQTQFCHKKLIQDNDDVFPQNNGIHKMDYLFFIPSLYCCPINYYFTTKQFIKLLYEYELESIFIHSIISRYIHHQQHQQRFIFDWIHSQYRNAKNI